MVQNASMNRGDTVRVKVVDGKEVVRRVWDQRGRMILVTNDEEFEKLLAGKPALWPVAFQPEDVEAVES